MQRIDNKLEDWRREDKKTIPGEATYVKSIIGAATVLLIFFPVSLLILIPLALVYHGAKAAIRLAKGKPAIEKASWPPKAVLKPLNLDKTRIPLDERKYDIVLFGVTGFTGALAAKYVARKYGNSVKWAIAGRRKEALEKIRDDLIKINSELKDLPLIVANSDDPSSLDEMVKDTRVIITTVGPYAVYGTELVKAAIENGTSYCDLTGEPQWCDVLIDKYDAAARKTGARIVNMAGHDCVPWDLLALKCAEYLKEKGDGEELVEVSFFDEARSTPSGGTLATVLESFPRKVYQSSTGFSPYEMDAEGNRSPYKTINEINFKPGYTEEFGKYSSFFIMSAVIYKCVQRSNALNGYGHRLVYKELEVVPNLPTLISKYLRLPVLGAILALPPLRERLLPKPGEGASESQLKNGFLQVTCIAKGNKGTQLLARIYFDVDPGYQDTARMIVESGLAMALNRDKLKCGPDGGGVLTPASCQGSVLLDRLVDTGSKFCIKEI